MTLAETWTGRAVPPSAYLAAGLPLLIAPFCRRSLRGDASYRMAAFAGVLLWVVLFNPKAESPTYIIAAFGAAFWGLAAPRTAAKVALLVLFVVLTELASTDLMPKPVRVQWVQPYRLKALPSALIWSALTWQLLTRRGPEKPRHATLGLEPKAPQAGGANPGKLGALRALVVAQVVAVATLGAAARGTLPGPADWSERAAALAFYPVWLGFPAAVAWAAGLCALSALERSALIAVEVALSLTALLAVLPMAQ